MAGLAGLWNKDIYVGGIVIQLIQVIVHFKRVLIQFSFNSINCREYTPTGPRK